MTGPAVDAEGAPAGGGMDRELREGGTPGPEEPGRGSCRRGSAARFEAFGGRLLDLGDLSGRGGRDWFGVGFG